MPESMKVSVESAMKEKIEYLGLNFERVPKSLIATEKLDFKVLKGYDEKQFKQYKFIKISDIDILLSPTHRMDSLEEKYDKARPLYMYLDSQNEENAERYTTFLRLLKKVEISEVEYVEQEQQMLSEELPFKVKYNGNYLWQIYYSEYEDRYFMLVPTEDSDYSTFFYLLKKKIENKETDKIFVPISYLEYSGNILKRQELKDLENYLWLFTNDYPAIYEVTNKRGKQTLQIIGETEVYGKIKTLYKNVYENSKEAGKFFKLLKALFILQTNLSHYYKFDTNINNFGELELYLNGQRIKYEMLLKFISSEYKKAVELEGKTKEEIKIYEEKFNEHKTESIKLEKEYIEKEKMISTFLECKKTFFGKVKYFFSGTKKTSKLSGKKLKEEKVEKENEKEEKEEETKTADNASINMTVIENKNYTLDELIKAFKFLEISENKNRDIVQDINAIKLKNKNLKKKIENATAYINEINKHKKSIFEFWKYSNKDEVAALEEGEEEEVNVYKIKKIFNYENDFESFGEKIDKAQRLKFTDAELESSYIASTNMLELMSKISKRESIELVQFTRLLNELKEEKDKLLDDNEEFDIFGGEISNKDDVITEAFRDKYQILDIRKGMQPIELKKALNEATKEVKKAIKKNNLDEEVYVFKVTEKPIKIDGLQAFSLNEEAELKKYNSVTEGNKKLYLYRLKLERGTNFIAFSNIVMFNNKNIALPTGMNGSNRILINTEALSIQEVERKTVNIKQLENEKNDYSRLILKTIEVIELESTLL